MRAIIPGENDKQQVTDLKGNAAAHTAGTRMNARGSYRRIVHGNQRNPKKDAHRIRVKQRTFSARSFDAIAINNDSSSSVKLSAVGHLNEVGTITWPREFSDAETNRPISFPAVIEGRSTLFGMVTHNVHIFPEGSVYGFCAQLSCGRAFVMTRNLPTWKAIELKTKALVSWISSGKWGFQMNDTQYRPYLQR